MQSYNTNILLDYRLKDHKTKLFNNKQAFFMQNYISLLEQKTDSINKYINIYLRKSFIKLNLSAVAALMLLIRKLDDRLRFCIDYKALNEIIVKN